MKYRLKHRGGRYVWRGHDDGGGVCRYVSLGMTYQPVLEGKYGVKECNPGWHRFRFFYDPGIIEYRLFPPHLRLWGYIINSTSIDPNLMPLGSV